MERPLLQCTRNVSRSFSQISRRNARSQTLTCHTQRQARRCLHTTSPTLLKSQPPKTRDRGPKSNEDTQTDFSALDVLRNTVAPATSIDACTGDGFALNNQMRISGSGILLIGGEAFRWRPWLREGRKEGTIGGGGTEDDAMTGKLLNAKGQWEVEMGAWGVLELCWPKPGMSPYHPSY
jgi:NADH dehydrogenase [ubiquinone] 1 alpha subcomplex assembly factor 3